MRLIDEKRDRLLETIQTVLSDNKEGILDPGVVVPVLTRIIAAVCALDLNKPRDAPRMEKELMELIISWKHQEEKKWH